jgi:hypothetical protein
MQLSPLTMDNATENNTAEPAQLMESSRHCLLGCPVTAAQQHKTREFTA